MNTIHASWIIFLREVRAELRSRELLNTTIVFALLVVVLFNFAFEPASGESRRLGPGLLWIAFLFAGSLMLNPCFSRELTNDTLSALRMAPVSTFSILLGKVFANMMFLMLTELLLLPIFAVLYNVPIWPVIGRLLLVLVLGSFGLIITGTVFSSITAHARMRELLLPLLLLPLLTPVLIAAVESTASLFSESPELPQAWLSFLAGFDILFFTASWILCEYLVEE